LGHLIAPFTELSSQVLAIEDAGQCGIDPYRMTHPIATRGERGEKPSVGCAAKGNRSIRQCEHMTPELIAGPERLHRREIGAAARLDNVHCRRTRRRCYWSCWSCTACDDDPRRNRDAKCGSNNRDGRCPRASRDEARQHLRTQREDAFTPRSHCVRVFYESGRPKTCT